VAGSPDYNPGALVRELIEHDVDFVVVGGVAVVMQAMPRFTKDLDICYSPAQENLNALGRALLMLDAHLRGIDDDVPFVPDGRTLRGTRILCLTTSAGDIDLLVEPFGGPSYETLRRRADVMEVADHQVRVASIEDLLAMKRAAGRPQDLIDVEALEAAARLRKRRRKLGGG
jgi:Nucleotidyl transferase AbiEii toxin, Type IV TA system